MNRRRMASFSSPERLSQRSNFRRICCCSWGGKLLPLLEALLIPLLVLGGKAVQPLHIVAHPLLLLRGQGLPLAKLSLEAAFFLGREGFVAAPVVVAAIPGEQNRAGEALSGSPIPGGHRGGKEEREGGQDGPGPPDGVTPHGVLPFRLTPGPCRSSGLGPAGLRR